MSLKGEVKSVMKTRTKWIVLLGLVLSALSLFLHFLLAGFTHNGYSEYQSSVTIFSWRPILGNADIPKNSSLYRRLWGPVRPLESLHPHAIPRRQYAEPRLETSGYIFVRIQGGFHEIRNSICDVVVVARLLNATLVVPEIQSTTSKKGISSEFKSFAYLYSEEQFMTALAKDVNVIKTLPKNLKMARKMKKIPLFKVPYQSPPYFFLHHVLPVLSKHRVVELVISDGGCLQAILPPQFEEFQRLRCRVAYNALLFRREVQDLATNILHRLRSPGRPYIAFDPGMTRDALAYHGCAELFQDVHTELIQHRRSWMIKRGIVKGKLLVDSAIQRQNGACPLMPEEIGVLLRAYGYSWDTVIYISGGEVFGGQRILISLHAMFENVVDRTSLSTTWELNKMYGRETNLVDNRPKNLPRIDVESKREEWKLAGPRPRPLPPPPARRKYPYNIEGWWGWVAESDNEPESTVMELRTNAHKLLWEAIDYIVCVEADVFIPGFDRDGKGHPNFASLVMGQRLYQSAALRTFRPDRKEVIRLLKEAGDQLYKANGTWLTSIRRHLRKSLLDGLTEASMKSKQMSFLSHPVPECSCTRHNGRESFPHALNSTVHSQLQAALGAVNRCPAWMDTDKIAQSKEKDNEEDLDEDDTSISGLFFSDGGKSHESGGGEIGKEESPHLEDQEELEGGDG